MSISTPPNGTPERRHGAPGRRQPSDDNGDNPPIRIGPFGRAVAVLLATIAVASGGWVMLTTHNVELMVRELHIRHMQLDADITACQKQLRTIEQGHTSYP